MKLVQRTVYFRPEDIELWNAIDNKAQWLHEQLNKNNTSYITKFDPIDVDKIKPKTTGKLVNNDIIATLLYGKCGHLLDDRGKCLTKGCKGK